MSTQVTMPVTSGVQAREASPNAWLWWKESRQLAPLLIMMLLVAGLIPVVITLVNTAFNWSAFRLPTSVMMLAFPGLFATGAGPLLIGQERALRTIDWLSLLPVGVRRIVRTKLFVALVGLAIMWLFVLLVTPLMFLSGARDMVPWRVGTNNSYTESVYSYTFWISHSIYVLLAGFFVSWRIKNQFHALIALIPLAFLPMILAGLCFDRPVAPAKLEWATFWFTLVGIAILVPLGNRAALRALGPAPAPTVGPSKAIYGGLSTGTSVVAQTPQFGTRFAPLVWQSLHSARGTILFLVAILAIAILACWTTAWTYDLSAGSSSARWSNFLNIGFLLTPLAVSWLGVLVFSGDGSALRVRFLADRGISPGLTYWARHALPVAILATALCLYAAFLLRSPWLVENFGIWQPDFMMPSFILIALIALGIYGVSQWIAQMFRTTILNVIMAPIVSALAIGWFAFVVGSYDFPLWAVAIIAVLPLLATRVMMRRYMDSRDRPMIFVAAAVVILVAIGLPLLDAARRIAQVPGMARSQRASLMEEGRLSADPAPVLVHLNSRGVWQEGTVDDYDPESGRLLSKVEQAKQEIDSYDADVEKLLSATKAIQANGQQLDTYAIQSLSSPFMAARYRFTEAEDTDTAFASFEPWIELGTLFLNIYRSTPRIAQQTSADIAEILLIDTLQLEQLKPYWEKDSVRAAVAQIGNPDSRAQARREALLASWYASQRQNSNLPVRLEILDSSPPGLHQLTRRYREQWILACLDGIEASRIHSNDDGWLRKLHAITSPNTPFELSLYSVENRAHPPMQSHRYYHNDVASYWGRDWEYVTFDE